MDEEYLPLAVFTVPEVAKILRIGRTKAYNLIKQGKIESIRIGRLIRIPYGKMDEEHFSPAIFTVAEIAKILRIGRAKAYGLVKQGKIESIRIGRLIRIPYQSLENYIKREGGFKEQWPFLNGAKSGLQAYTSARGKEYGRVFFTKKKHRSSKERFCYNETKG
jgi:excisionase family DNA binding protein